MREVDINKIEHLETEQEKYELRGCFYSWLFFLVTLILLILLLLESC